MELDVLSYCYGPQPQRLLSLTLHYISELSHKSFRKSRVDVDLLAQGGAYAEHTIQSFEVEGTGITVDVGGPAFTITIGAGCGCRLQVSMARYSNAPTIAPPWARQAVTTTGMESKL